MSGSALPAWLPLLARPYADVLNSRSAWDLALPDRTPVHVERDTQGFNTAVYRVRAGDEAYSCKLFVVDERRRAEREWTALCAIQAAGLVLAPVPVALAAEGPLPQPAIVTRPVEGLALAAQSVTPSMLAGVVTSLARIHRLQPAPGQDFLPAWGQPAGYAAYVAEARSFLQPVSAWVGGLDGPTRDLPGWVADLPDLLPAMQQVLDKAEALIAPAGPAGGSAWVPALVRLDGNLDTAIRRPDGCVVFVGWEYSGWGDPAFDLAELRWHPRSAHVPQPAWDEAMAGYPAPARDPGFDERLAIYSRLLPAWWAARSALYLLEGIGQTQGRRRLVRMPARVFRRLRGQFDGYLVALGLMQPAEVDEDDED